MSCISLGLTSSGVCPPCLVSLSVAVSSASVSLHKPSWLMIAPVVIEHYKQVSKPMACSSMLYIQYCSHIFVFTFAHHPTHTRRLLCFLIQNVPIYMYNTSTCFIAGGGKLCVQYMAGY